MESRDLVSVSRLILRPIFASLQLSLGFEGSRPRLGLRLNGYRSRDFDYQKEMA